ncbi:Thioesterase/thiol ester dehydrase-isomerase [Gymnopus androsaceus JB14]|uniref:Thioesterase/thiol ester dehydrase-isomerase n=1 Tax=Gymnopus androsaceus JB14 TaxID=1447944 RepID=A0A6A4H877_9AGAR|nr:Thioesterase/thiol ester dehydrase-isomerase [Gymnopus androsaceus JB14]
MAFLGRSLHRSNPPRFLQKRHNSIKALQAAFRDPSSPLYLAPGTEGPASPDELLQETESEPEAEALSFNKLLKQGRAKLVQAGFHSPSIWEQPITWGDQDSFQHVNNVHYVRFFESSRIRWMTDLGHRLGGPARTEALLKGKGISLIIKSLTVNYRRPVTYPDTLLVSHKPIPPPSPSPSESSHDPACLYLTSSAFSVNQQAFVAHCNEVLVWYDYEKLRKCVPGEEYHSAVWEPFTWDA